MHSFIEDQQLLFFGLRIGDGGALEKLVAQYSHKCPIELQMLNLFCQPPLLPIRCYVLPFFIRVLVRLSQNNFLSSYQEFLL